MIKETIRHTRIIYLHKAAKSGKYTWADLREKARKMKISEPTVKSYLEEVQERLEREGILK